MADLAFMAVVLVFFVAAVVGSSPGERVFAPIERVVSRATGVGQEEVP